MAMLGVRLTKRILDIYPRLLCKREYQRQVFEGFNERPVEFRFVFEKLMHVYPRTILDVGSGTTALPHLMRNCGFLVTAIDNIRDFWPHGMANRHYYVIDDDITDTHLAGKFDFITCISVLEHIEQSDRAVDNMFRLLNPGGYVVLTFPYTEHNYVRNVYQLPGSRSAQDTAYITQSYSRRELTRWVERNHGEIIEQEFWQFCDGPYWTVGEQVIPPRQVTKEDKHQITCVLIQARGQ
jgi:2-polyprenyl-3-methyl-5-hydroxy-6-metoxy-1,4-benzoquinol methylase